MQKIKYEQRIIAFIDILGFKELVNKSKNDETILQIIYESLDRMHVIKMAVDSDKDELTKPKVSIFSDNIVISSLAGSKESILGVFWNCMYLQISLLVRGVYLRGGISSGELYHDNNFVVGPALIKAYELESKYAIYPRIVLDDCIDYNNNFLMSTDFDGIRYLDILGNIGFWEKAFKERGIDIVRSLEKIVLQDLNKTSNIGIKAKYTWLLNYIQKTNRRIDSYLKEEKDFA
jgi:hypothetical protein